MAVRSVILWFGDESINGTRPVSELAALHPTYDDPQADSRIWNVTAQAWQPTEAGVNTSETAQRWGPETRAREGLRTRIPTGYVDHIKVAVPNSTLTFVDQRRNADGTVAGGSLRPCWHPSAKDTTAYVKLIAQIKAAAVAAAGAGDTLRIDGIVCGLFVNEALHGMGWSTFGQRMIETLTQLYYDTVLVAGVPFGSFRNDAGLVPIVLVLPHGDFAAGLTEDQKAWIQNVRLQLFQLKNEMFRISVFPTFNLVTADDLNFDTPSLIEFGENVVGAFYAPTAPNDTGLPEAEMVGIIGDSIFDGVCPNVGVPAYLLGAQTGNNIWSRDRMAYEPDQIAVNNLISQASVAPAYATGIFDISLPLGHLFRAEFGEVWLTKLAVIGSHAAPYYQRSSVSQGPLRDPFKFDWNPAAPASHCDLFLEWLEHGAAYLRSVGKAPRLRLLTMCLGTNDLLAPISQTDPKEYLQVVPTLKSIVDRVKQRAGELGILHEDFRVVLALPDSKIGSPLVPWADGLTEVVRADMQNWAAATPEIRTFDLTDLGKLDALHLNVQGTIDAAKAVYDAWKAASATEAQPLFVESKDAMKKALRLSQVPSDNDALYQIDEAIRVARVRLYQALGETKVTSLLAIPFVQQPRSADDYQRATACSVEIKMVRAELMRVMPMMFMDGANTVQAWQQEAAFREGSYLQTRAELQRLEDDIRQGLTILINGTAGESQIATLYPDDFVNPGDTLHGEVF